LTGVGFHTLRHTCASLLIESGLSPLRLQRWMGHHSPAFTLETYGHLIDGDLGPPLDLHHELRLEESPQAETQPRTAWVGQPRASERRRRKAREGCRPAPRSRTCNSCDPEVSALLLPWQGGTLLTAGSAAASRA
jgi:hypothetical protein